MKQLVIGSGTTQKGINMGSYKEIEGDLIKFAFEQKFDIIAHGANCFSTMGAGIALQIKENFPTVYFEDKHDIRSPIQKLGDFSLTCLESGLIIINLYSQYYPGPNLDYEALTLSLRKVNTIFSGMSIGLPKIGAGIAKGDWERIKQIIKDTLIDMNVTVVIYKPE